MHAVFRYEEFQRFMQARGIQQDASVRQALSYHCRRGKLLRIRRSLYAVNPELNASKEVDPYLVAAYAAPQVVIAYAAGHGKPKAEARSPQ
ncbi:MAG: hypothetical protein GY821_17820 [Gammaproteobacteria bacterium]|nr:hypothetical protein [Gammaproteobacteria bacterium]